MIIVNPQKVRRADIVVGIPSYNEADRIGFVIRQIDRGLKKYFPNKSAVIVNVDNNSSDKTKQVFLKTKTSTPKIYISTSPKTKGKGHNFYNLFKLIKKFSSKINITLDADLKSIKPDWIRKLAKPIRKGYDFAVPIYRRNKRDGLITNHFCHPLIYGLLNYNISQPIAGDFSFSLEMVQHWLSKKWPANVYQFGIDIFMTTEAILNGFKICQVNLPRKAHKPTRLRVNSMFFEIADVLFNQLITYKRLWQNQKIRRLWLNHRIKRPRIFYRKPRKRPQPLKFDPQRFEDIFQLGFQVHERDIKKILSLENYQLLKKIHQTKRIRIKPDLWSKIVYDFLYNYQSFSNKKKLLEALEKIAFGRFFSYIKKTNKMNFQKAGEEIVKQAKIFHQNKNYLLKK
jgi:glycosyltransferase involved in cell wall biosynthesis